ncbi:unnamed protein product [Ceratitis capitata]|uniref:(Mediterranean fruit fly) hypothetical protein n=1 Tax=Ceratitis capitata TaxID=7213 RepID=A0A811V746_CERCA|nr:unnamed protein product [Ceratitis capitata]
MIKVRGTIEGEEDFRRCLPQLALRHTRPVITLNPAVPKEGVDSSLQGTYGEGARGMCREEGSIYEPITSSQTIIKLRQVTDHLPWGHRQTHNLYCQRENRRRCGIAFLWRISGSLITNPTPVASLRLYDCGDIAISQQEQSLPPPHTVATLLITIVTGKLPQSHAVTC